MLGSGVNPWLDRLSAKQLNFCCAYLSGLSCKRALIKAGYSEIYADKFAKNVLLNKKILGFIRYEQCRQVNNVYMEQINFEQEVKRRALNEADPELRRDYAKEVRAWEKQKREFDIKLQELEKKSQETKSDHNITINIEKAVADEDRA